MRNHKLDQMIEEMVDNHANFIRMFGELLRRSYRQGRMDERMGCIDPDEEQVKQLK